LNDKIPRLSEDFKKSCEDELTLNECFETLKTFQENKTPGNDGLSTEFYKTFWPIVGHLLVESLNFSYRHGELCYSPKVSFRG